MQRSTARPPVTRNLGRSLSYRRSASLKVLVKPLNSSSSWASHFLSRNMELEMEKWKNALDLLENTEDESLESTLDSMDLCLDEKCVLNVLHYSFPMQNLCRFLKWASSKKEFRATTSILVKLENLFTFYRPTNLYALWEWTKEISEKENGLFYPQILRHFLIVFNYWRNEKGAFEVYEKFEEFGWIRDGDVYYFTITTLCQTLAYDLASLVCQKMLDTGMLPEWKMVYGIIVVLCEADRAKEAHGVYLATRNLFKNWNRYLVKALLRVVCCLAKVDETVHLAKEMLLLGDISAENRRYFHNHFLWVIRGLCRKNDIEGAKKLLFEMIEKGPPPGSEVFHSIIRCLSKAGDLEDAREILELAERRGLTPRISSYNVLISGYVKVGLLDEACNVLFAAKKKFTELCPIGLYALIEGYCSLGEFVKALKLFSELKNYGVVPNVDEYNKLIQSLSLCLKDLDPETAQKLLEEIREKGLYLPHFTESIERAVEDFQQGMIIGSRHMRPQLARSRVVWAQSAQTHGLCLVRPPPPKWLALHGASKLLGGPKYFQNRKQHWEGNWVVSGLRFVTTGMACLAV